MRKELLISSLFIPLFVNSGFAYAQSSGPSGILGSGNADLASPEFEQPLKSRPLSLPDVKKYVPETQRYGGEVSITQVKYDGVTIPDMVTEIEKIITDFQLESSGRLKSISEIAGLRDKITQAYIRKGYINSGAIVPKQDLSDNVLDINIIEGRLTEIPVSFKTPTIANALGFSREMTERKVTDVNLNSKLDAEDQKNIGWRPGQLRRSFVVNRLGLKSDEPLNQNQLQKKFQRLTNDPSIKKIDAALTPGERPGEARLFLDVEESNPLWLYLTTASDRAPSIGGERGAIGGGFRNLLGYGDVFSFEVGLTEGLNDAQARYDVPIGTSRFSVNGHIEYSDAEVVEEPLSNLNILSDSFSFGGGVSAKLLDDVYSKCKIKNVKPSECSAESISTGSYFLQAGVDLSKKKTENALLGIPFSFSPGAVNGETDNLILTGSLDGSIRSTKQVAAARLAVGYGLDAISNTQTNAPPENFVKVTAQTQYARVISENLGHQVIAKINGQWTDKTLFTSERFSFGGIDSVRGYRKNDVLTDRGVLGSFEYRMSLKPFFKNQQMRYFDNWSLGVFAEGGYGENTLLPDPTSDTLVSAGAQLNFEIWDGLTGQFYYGHRLKKIASPRSNSFQDSGLGFRLNFSGVNL